MPILNIDTDEEEEVTPVPEDTTPTVETVRTPSVPVHKYRTQSELKTSTMFNKDMPLDTLASNISGMDWEVSYFLQIRGINESPKLPDINTSQTVLKYNRVSKLIIKLQSAIDQTDVNEISGEAIINAGFIPNYGDPFIATLTGGREAVFVITEVTKNNYNLHNVYKVTFKLHAFLDRSGTFYNDLVFKTITEYVYDKDHIQDFSAPIILKAEYYEKLDLRRQPNELLNYFMDYMVNSENNVIAAPTQSSIYIDTMLDGFLTKITNHDDNPEFIKLNKVNINLETKDSVWDVLIKRDISLLKRVERDLGFKYTPNSISAPTARHASYLGINFITDKITTRLTPEFNINEDASVHDVPVIVTDKYIFSNNFYTQNVSECTKFELLVLQYLRGESIDTDVLDFFLKEYPLWSREHQYYLIPILILLVKSSIATTYSSL
jgi:hypothetical protein